MSIEDAYHELPLIKVVGISASGKSTLVKALRQRGYRARPVSQEHSNVPSLWQQFEEPEIDIDNPMIQTLLGLKKDTPNSNNNKKP